MFLAVLPFAKADTITTFYINRENARNAALELVGGEGRRISDIIREPTGSAFIQTRECLNSDGSIAFSENCFFSELINRYLFRFDFICPEDTLFNTNTGNCDSAPIAERTVTTYYESQADARPAELEILGTDSLLRIVQLFHDQISSLEFFDECRNNTTGEINFASACNENHQTQIVRYIFRFNLTCPAGQTININLGCSLPFEVIKNPASCPAEGNPINVATGNKYQLETDFSGSGDFALSLSRHYNSLKAFDGDLGQQWRHNYERSLTIDLLASPAQISVNRPDGVVYTFTQQGSLWVSDADVIETLFQTSNGYRLKSASNIIEDYDNSGRLLSMTNTRSQTITLSYNTTTSLLETVTDHFGRTLTFAYDTNSRLTSFNDPEGNAYHYEYDVAGNLDKVIYPDSTPNDLVDNPQRLYLYENTNFPNHLTGIIDETGARFASWGYDNVGRGVFSEHNNGTERVDIVYNNDGTTTVTDQIGAVRTYTFDVLFGVAKTSNVAGDQCTTCGSDAQAISYDANGFVASRTDFNGNITNFTRDNRGLELTRTEAVGTAQQRTITTIWHPNLRLPLEIVEPNKTTTFTYDANGNLLSRAETDTSAP